VSDEFTIKYLAEHLNVSTKTIKKWESEEKIPQARRNNFDWRVYTQEEMERIKKIVEEHEYFKPVTRV